MGKPILSVVTAGATDRDYVSRQFDGVFKSDLPNDQYAVAVQFAADPAVTSKPVRVNLIANDKNVIPNLTVPVEAKLIHGPIRLMPLMVI